MEDILSERANANRAAGKQETLLIVISHVQDIEELEGFEHWTFSVRIFQRL